jgi:hypothetical protein
LAPRDEGFGLPLTLGFAVDFILSLPFNRPFGLGLPFERAFGFGLPSERSVGFGLLFRLPGLASPCRVMFIN